MKEKELLSKNQEKHVAISQKLNQGFKIKVSSSQIFNNHMGSSGEDDIKDDLLSIKESSSPSQSDDNHSNSHFVSAEKKSEFERELSMCILFYIYRKVRYIEWQEKAQECKHEESRVFRKPASDSKAWSSAWKTWEV